MSYLLKVTIRMCCLSLRRPGCSPLVELERTGVVEQQLRNCSYGARNSIVDSVHTLSNGGLNNRCNHSFSLALIHHCPCLHSWSICLEFTSRIASIYRGAAVVEPRWDVLIFGLKMKMIWMARCATFGITRAIVVKETDVRMCMVGEKFMKHG